MNIAGVNYESLVDGEGVRTTIYVSGCSHRCPGCHNPETWSSEYGTPLDDALLGEMADNIIRRPFLSGITLSGGDPVEHANEVIKMIGKLASREALPNGNIWLYTGYTWENLVSASDPYVRLLLDCCRVVVDGPFIQSQADKRLRFRGSRNQRIIDVPKSLSSGQIVIWKN